MNIQESQAMKRTVDAAMVMITALATQLDRIEQRLDELEQRRGPGRPPTRMMANEAVQR